MSDTEETRARAKAHEVLHYDGEECRIAHRALCDRTTVLILDHERVLAEALTDVEKWRDLWKKSDDASVDINERLGWAIAEQKAWFTVAQNRETERDALLTRLEHAEANGRCTRANISEAEVAALASQLSEARVRVERLEGALGEAKSAGCKNTPCPVCGDGPSGEWSEGDDVDCDGCGTSLYVESITECQGVSVFGLSENKCAECKGSGFTGSDDAEESFDCAACEASGYRVPTLDEAREAAGIARAALEGTGRAT